ncbi:methionine adenosyltransferase domain-containing protein [Mesorhizobium sp. M0051]|uniref:methionine adenosyltransferase domain-containing protein n=1 Tax=Mesorhizobium sp. M0051 TaxID=2956862 RepID=UPI003336F06D
MEGPRPGQILVTLFGAAKIEEETIERVILELFFFGRKGIIQTLDLLRPIYRRAATYGLRPRKA